MPPKLLKFLSPAYATLAWLLAAIGVLHMATTWQLISSTPFTRVWFFGTGIAMVQAAALNLLHRSYGHSVVGLRWVTRGFNALLLGFAAVAGTATGATILELFGLLGVLAGLLVLSFATGAQRSDTKAGGN